MSQEPAPDETYSGIRLCLHKKSKLGGTKDIAKMAAPKAAQVVYNALRVGPRVILRSAFELLRANTITRILSAAVLLSIDTYALARGRISRKQYVINVTLALMLLVGGTAGWYLGNNIAALVVAEGVVLSILAGIAGAGVLGATLGSFAERLIGMFFKDDTADMLDICNKVFAETAAKYALSREEACEAADMVQIGTEDIRRMYASDNKQAFACELVEGCIKQCKSNLCQNLH
ncbi:MAG: hypothetical protein FWD98_05515 [Defluviitaleaceae bacterium]|nr:hypothetical protein [Defluviitaleaceae bacterium]